MGKIIKKQGHYLSNDCIVESQIVGLQAEDNQANIIDNEISGSDNKEKVVMKMEPFNDFFYKNCFYNSAFPVLKYFNKDIISILINDVVLYAYDKSTSREQLTLRYVQRVPLERLLLQEGIGLNSFEMSNNLINDIIESLSKDKPVVLWIDCYYSSIREDKYQKEHWPHTWLVYGYDKTKREILIIEHSHSDNLSYEKKTVSFEETINCYEGYLKNFSNQTNEASYFEFDSLKENGVKGELSSDYTQIYTDNINTNKHEIIRSLSELNEFITDYEVKIADQEHMNNHVFDLLNGFNQIINTKRVQFYTIKELFGQHSQFTGIIGEIVEAWVYIRGIIAKCYYSSIYRENSLIQSIEQLHIINELEYKLFNLCMGGLDFNE